MVHLNYSFNCLLQPCRTLNDAHFVCLMPDLRKFVTEHRNKMWFKRHECEWTLHTNHSFIDDAELDFYEVNL